jgi:hypothetical protein
LLGATPLLATPALAKRTAHGPSCTKIREALAGGQSQDEVAKDMKVSAATVQRCAANKRPAHRSAKNSATAPSSK